MGNEHNASKKPTPKPIETHTNDHRIADILETKAIPNTPNLSARDSNPLSSLFPPHHSTLRSTNLSFTHQSHPSDSSSTSFEFLPALSLTPLPSISLKKAKPLDIPHSNSMRMDLRKRQSSVLIAHNGITDKYISSRICKIAAMFWQKNIEPLSTSDQLEIGCSIFFSMLSTNDQMKKLMQSNFCHDQKIENASLRYLDMMGWLIRYLTTDNVNLPSLLSKLGTLHQKMGIKIQHFDPMLQALHDTFTYYFESKYSIEVKYAMDEIFSMAAQMMTGTELKFSTHLMDIQNQFQGTDIPFLKNLRACLASTIGKEYLYRYMTQTWCEEIPIFLQSLSNFKSRTTDKERFMVAKDIVKISIEHTALFAVNVSYDTRVDTIQRMNQLKSKFASKEAIEIKTDFFSEVERDMFKLIKANHWRKFVTEMQDLQSKSFNID